MNFNELSKYVFQKYSLKFTPVVPGSTELYVLKSPLDKSYFAMMSRIKKEDARLNGQGYIAVLDLKCGSFAATIRDLPGFTSAFRLKSNDWVGTWLSRGNTQAIKNAIDYAFKLAMNGDQTPIINEQYLYLPQEKTDEQYQAQRIKPRKEIIHKRKEHDEPEAIQKMRASYDYSILPAKGRAKNFYHQGQMMADYEDHYSASAAFMRYYPTYHDMNLAQLRTYFAWRSQIRKGNYPKTSTSYAFVYVYELLNNIGVNSAEDGYQKLQLFIKNYVQKYDKGMLVYLKKWLQDYVLYYHLGQDFAQKVFQKELKADHNYYVLLHPKQAKAEDVYQVFLQISSYLKTCLANKKLFKQMPKIIYEVWFQIMQVEKDKGLSYFHYHIAHRNLLTKHLFAGAVFYQRPSYQPQNYRLDEERQYFYQNNDEWQVNALLPNSRQKSDVNTLMHEIDRLTRQSFGLGRPLKPRKIEDEFLTAIKQGIKVYRQKAEEAKRPKIKINFADLGQIRADASQTRDSLLTDEEKQMEREEEQAELAQKKKAAQAAKPKINTYNLNKDELYFLLALLKKQPYQDYLKKHHLMASILADQINDKLFDEIGDSVIEFNEKDQPQIIADYQPDLENMFLKKE